MHAVDPEYLRVQRLAEDILAVVDAMAALWAWMRGRAA